MSHITCRLTAKNRDQLRNPTLGTQVRATFTFFNRHTRVTGRCCDTDEKGHSGGDAGGHGSGHSRGLGLASSSSLSESSSDSSSSSTDTSDSESN